MITNRFRFSFALAALLTVGGGGGAAVRAQAPQGPSATPLPMAVDLKKVPVGSWSEYRIADGQNTMQVRMALVNRTGNVAHLETDIKGGPLGALGRTTMRMSVPLVDAAEIKPTEQVIQLGENAPMMLPAQMAGQSQSFKKLDPKKRVGIENVTVAAGSFPKAEHYQDKGASGETVDYWISKNVLPFGLIKVTSSGAPGGKSVAMELTAQGGGAKPVITKTPQPFDPAAIMKQAQPAMGAGAGPGAPGAPGANAGTPMRPIPSPHPGMPPTSPGAARPPMATPPAPSSSTGSPPPPSSKDPKK